MPTDILSYKSKPILRLTPEGKTYPRVQFGLAKARIIVDNFGVIKDFINNAEAGIVIPQAQTEES